MWIEISATYKIGTSEIAEPSDVLSGDYETKKIWVNLDHVSVVRFREEMTLIGVDRYPILTASPEDRSAIERWINERRFS